MPGDWLLGFGRDLAPCQSRDAPRGHGHSSPALVVDSPFAARTTQRGTGSQAAARRTMPLSLAVVSPRLFRAGRGPLARRCYLQFPVEACRPQVPPSVHRTDHRRQQFVRSSTTGPSIVTCDPGYAMNWQEGAWGNCAPASPSWCNGAKNGVHESEIGASHLMSHEGAPRGSHKSRPFRGSSYDHAKGTRDRNSPLREHRRGGG